MPSPQEVKNIIAREGFEKYSRDPSTNWEFNENFSRRPLIASDLDPAAFSQAAQRLLTAANQNLILSGTNMTSALGTFTANLPGITFTTAGANNDQALLSPLTVNSVQGSMMGGTTGAAGTSIWRSDRELHFETILAIPTITTVRVVAGFKLTTAPDVGTDNDGVTFQFDPASGVSGSRWRCVTNVGGTDTDTAESFGGNSGVGAVAASAVYRLQIRILNRNAAFLINSQLVGTSPILTSPMAFIPMVGIQATAAAARSFRISRLRVSRPYA